MLNDFVIYLLFLLQNYENNSINPNLKQYKICLKRYSLFAMECNNCLVLLLFAAGLLRLLNLLAILVNLLERQLTVLEVLTDTAVEAGEMLSLCFDQHVDHPFRTDVIQSLLRGGVLGLCGALKQRMLNDDVPHNEYKNNNHFQCFLDLLHSVEVKHQTVEWYANELCISPKYLTIICKKHSGKTANEWITEHVLEDIRYYLKQTDYSIKQICDLIGFPNPSFFGKYVKEHFGMTPIQIRTNKA